MKEWLPVPLMGPCSISNDVDSSSHLLPYPACPAAQFETLLQPEAEACSQQTGRKLAQLPGLRAPNIKIASASPNLSEHGRKTRWIIWNTEKSTRLCLPGKDTFVLNKMSRTNPRQSSNTQRPSLNMDRNREWRDMEKRAGRNGQMDILKDRGCGKLGLAMP